MRLGFLLLGLALWRGTTCVVSAGEGTPKPPEANKGAPYDFASLINFKRQMMMGPGGMMMMGPGGMMMGRRAFAPVMGFGVPMGGMMLAPGLTRMRGGRGYRGFYTTGGWGGKRPRRPVVSPPAPTPTPPTPTPAPPAPTPPVDVGSSPDQSASGEETAKSENSAAAPTPNPSKMIIGTSNPNA